MAAFVSSLPFVSTFAPSRAGLERRCGSGRRRAAPAPVAAAVRMVATNETHELEGRTISRAAQPLRNYVLVKVAESPETTEGGLILSSGAKEKPTYGEAVGVGPGSFYPNGLRVPMTMRTGDTVLYGKYGGSDVTYDGAKHTFVTQNDILCLLEGGRYEPEAVRPIFDRVLVKVEQAAGETKSGILISGTQEKGTSGTVVAMGPGRFMENGEYEPIDFAVGDKVMYGKYSGTELKFRGEDYIILRVSDIFAHWKV